MHLCFGSGLSIDFEDCRDGKRHPSEPIVHISRFGECHLPDLQTQLDGKFWELRELIQGWMQIDLGLSSWWVNMSALVIAVSSMSIQRASIEGSFLTFLPFILDFALRRILKAFLFCQVEWC